MTSMGELEVFDSSALMKSLLVSKLVLISNHAGHLAEVIESEGLRHVDILVFVVSRTPHHLEIRV
jgi:hypothetical protein